MLLNKVREDKRFWVVMPKQSKSFNQTGRALPVASKEASTAFGLDADEVFGHRKHNLLPKKSLIYAVGTSLTFFHDSELATDSRKDFLMWSKGRATYIIFQSIPCL